MSVGSIVFGPSGLVPNKDSASGYSIGASIGLKGAASSYHACNCIGAQPGETKCPCTLRAEAEKGRKMIEDGVVINGKRYNLVPA